MFVSGTARSGRYYVIVHFYQPNYSSFLGKVVVSGQRSTSALLTFRYCPYVSGCRAIGTSQFREGMSESIYIGRQNNILTSLVIPGDKGVWIVSGLEISYYLGFRSRYFYSTILEQAMRCENCQPRSRRCGVYE